MKTLIAALLLVGAPFFATATADPNGDTQRAYVFTLDLMRRYGTAVRALEAAEAHDPELKTEGHWMGTPDVLIAHMEAHPNVYAFFKAQGFSVRDAVLVGVAIGEARLAADQPDDSQSRNVSRSQVEFIRAHRKELQALLAGVGTVRKAGPPPLEVRRGL